MSGVIRNDDAKLTIIQESSLIESHFLDKDDASNLLQAQNFIQHLKVDYVNIA